MPILKKNNMLNMMPEEGEKKCRCGCAGEGGANLQFGKKIIMTLVGVLLVYLVFFVGTLIHNNIKKYYYIGRADQAERTITVNGYGKVTGSNDIAVTTLGYSNTDPDVAKAQADNKKVMEALMADLKKFGVADKDLQTNYTIYPEYNYTQDKGQVFTGYHVANNVTIKIRDLTKISAILSLPGKYGATEVGGLNFTIDDLENLKAQARSKALTDAFQKARRLSQALGVQLVEVVAFNEQEDYQPTPVPMPMMLKADGMGAGMGVGPGPEAVATGSLDVPMNVSITYKIVPAY